VIDQDRQPAMGKTSAAAGFMRRMFAATCLSIAAAHGAHASPNPIVDDGLSTNSAVRSTEFPNLTPNSVFTVADSTGNAGLGLEAFARHLDRDIFSAAGLMVSASLSDARDYPVSLEPDGGPRSFAHDLHEWDAEHSDSTAMLLTGLGFVLIGAVIRGLTRRLRRRKSMTAIAIDLQPKLADDYEAMGAAKDAVGQTVR
jgi:hypothetical protein